MKKIGKPFFADILRSLFYALLLSFATVLIFAVFVKTFSLSEKVIVAVNAGLKTLCILLGVLFGVKDKQSGFLKGFLIGGLYIGLTFLIFGLMDGSLSDARFSIFDLLLGFVVGVIGGIIKVNIFDK